MLSALSRRLGKEIVRSIYRQSKDKTTDSAPRCFTTRHRTPWRAKQVSLSYKCWKNSRSVYVNQTQRTPDWPKRFFIWLLKLLKSQFIFSNFFKNKFTRTILLHNWLIGTVKNEAEVISSKNGRKRCPNRFILFKLVISPNLPFLMKF